MTERPDAPTAKTKLCQIGYCLPGVLSRWKPPPRVQPPDPYKEAREQCNGVLANIVGKGTTCLDPSDPKAREFRDCKDGFCAPTMVALTNGRYKRGFQKLKSRHSEGTFPIIRSWARTSTQSATWLSVILGCRQI